MYPKYKTKFSDGELQNALDAGKPKAKELVENQDKWERFKKTLYPFFDKWKKIPVIGSVIDDIVTMAELADAYVHKKYINIPFGTILSIVAALLYVLSPVDLIPDALPVIGYIDDVAVVMLVLRFGVDKDLNKFRKWKEEILRNKTELFQKAYTAELSEFIGTYYLSAVLLTDDSKLKLLLCQNENSDDELECIIRETAVPAEALHELDVKTATDIINVLEKPIASENIKWVNGAEKRIFSEPDFESKWDNYIILED